MNLSRQSLACAWARPVRFAPKLVRVDLGQARFWPSLIFQVKATAKARQEPRPARTESLIAIAITITRTRTRTSTILGKQICPGGQRPDWLRVGSSDEVKFSVSSPRSEKSTVPRSRPRH
jgi:hypothetical protein